MKTRALSALDSAFLFFERPRQPLHVGCVVELDGAIEFPKLVELFRARIDTLPRLRQRPVRSTLDLRAPSWQDDPSFAIPHHVHRTSLPAPGGPAELHEVVDSLFSVPLSPERPLWEIYLIEGLAGGRSALLWKVHHCMIDGASGVQLLTLCTDPDSPPRPVDTPGPARRPARPAGAFAASSLGDVGGSLLELASIVSSMAFTPVSPLPFHGSLGERRRLVWSTFPLSDLLAIRGAVDCKVNDVILAIVAGALRRYLGGRGVSLNDLHVRVGVPVSVRGEEDREALGNMVTAMFPVLPVGTADPTRRLEQVVRETASLKRRGQPRATALALAAAGFLPAPVQALLGRLAPDRTMLSTVVTNVPGPVDRRSVLGRRIEAIHPMVPLAQGMGLEFAVLSYGGRVSIAATADADLVSDVELMAAALTDAEAELRDAVLSPALRSAPLPSVAGMAIRELMRRDVVTVTRDDSLLDAYRLMKTKGIRHLPVLDGRRRLVGIVTHRDIMAAAKSSLDAEQEMARIHVLGCAVVSEIMEIHVSTAHVNEPAADVAQRLVRQKIGCVPVVDESNGLLGIVTTADFVRWAAEQLGGGVPQRAPAAAEATTSRIEAVR
jgi:WS/DGAT/MGAT family acyltransferase